MQRLLWAIALLGMLLITTVSIASPEIDPEVEQHYGEQAEKYIKISVVVLPEDLTAVHRQILAMPEKEREKLGINPKFPLIARLTYPERGNTPTDVMEYRPTDKAALTTRFRPRTLIRATIDKPYQQFWRVGRILDEFNQPVFVFVLNKVEEELAPLPRINIVHARPPWPGFSLSD